MFGDKNVGKIPLKMGKGVVYVLYLLQVHSAQGACGACALIVIVLFVYRFPWNSHSFQPVILQTFRVSDSVTSSTF